MNHTLALALAFGLSAAVLAADKELPKPHVYLKFEGDDTETGSGGAMVTLKHAEFKDKALVVNGMYPKCERVGQQQPVSDHLEGEPHVSFSFADHFHPGLDRPGTEL